MKLVLLFFCAILIILVFLILLIIFSTIKLNIDKLNIYNIEGTIKKKRVEKEIFVYLEFYLFGVLKIAKIRVNEKLLRKLKIKNDVESIKNDVKLIKYIYIFDIVKRLKLKLEKVNMDLEFGTDSLILTLYLVSIISSLIGILFAKTNPKEGGFYIEPLYNFGNSIKFNLNCIISAKVVHIIYVIYILLRKRRSNDERTSNRGSYDYSYE